jgi:hypothetical protein
MHAKLATVWIASNLLASVVFLSGCSRAGSDLVLPTLPHYSEGFQRWAAAELQGLQPPCPADAVLPGCSAVKRLVIDYGDLRARISAARGDH